MTLLPVCCRKIWEPKAFRKWPYFLVDLCRGKKAAEEESCHDISLLTQRVVFVCYCICFSVAVAASACAVPAILAGSGTMQYQAQRIRHAAIAAAVTLRPRPDVSGLQKRRTRWACVELNYSLLWVLQLLCLFSLFQVRADNSNHERLVDQTNRHIIWDTSTESGRKLPSDTQSCRRSGAKRSAGWYWHERQDRGWWGWVFLQQLTGCDMPTGTGCHLYDVPHCHGAVRRLSEMKVSELPAAGVEMT